MNKKSLTATESSSIFVISFILCQVLVLIVNILCIIFGSISGYNTTDLELFFNTAIGYLICVIALDLGMVLCFIFCKKKYQFQTVSKINYKRMLTYIAIGIVSFFALYPIVVCFDDLLIRLSVSINTIPYSLTTGNYFISLISLCILPAVCEELLFRGLILQGFRQNGKWLSIMLSSTMFAIYHMSLSQAIYPLLFGMLLSGIMYRENNILYSIITHAINNFLSLTMSYLNVSLVFNHWSYILLAIILCAIWISLIIFFINKTHRESQVKFTQKELTFTIISIIIMIVIWIISILNNLNN